MWLYRSNFLAYHTEHLSRLIFENLKHENSTSSTLSMQQAFVRRSFYIEQNVMRILILITLTKHIFTFSFPNNDEV